MVRNKTSIEKKVIPFIRAVKRKYHAQIILFGSRARGDFLKSSDYDFVVISSSFKGVHPHDRVILLLKEWKLPAAVDILAYTPEEFKEKAAMLTTVRVIKEEGIIL